MKAYMARIWGDISRDKRKLSFGLVLVGIALLLWGRLLLKQVPQAAVADPPIKVAAPSPASDQSSAEAAPRPVVFVDLSNKIRHGLFTTDLSQREVIRPGQANDLSQN